jgi:hypothetical protein
MRVPLITVVEALFLPNLALMLAVTRFTLEKIIVLYRVETVRYTNDSNPYRGCH